MPYKARAINIVGDSAGKQIEQRLIKQGAHWVKIETNYSTSYLIPELKLKYICTEDYTPLRTWGLLSSVKSGINKNPDMQNLPGVTSKDINYFKYSESIYKAIKSKSRWTYFDNVCEMDISAAYVTEAYNMTVISKDNYLKLINGPKSARLKVLGALATQRRETYFIGPDEIDTKLIPPNPLYRNVWFNICKNVDDAINRIYMLLGNDGIFYYVDNIYFYNKPELIQSVHEHFNSYGFKMKVIPLLKFAVFNSSKGAVIAIRRRDELKPKQFFVPKKRIIKFEII